MLQDVRFGLRLLWNQKAFSIAALLTLALCIGANSAIFTVLDAVVLRALPYPESERLVAMYNLYPGVGFGDRGSNGVPDYLDRRQLTNVFSEVTLIGYSGYDMGRQGSPERVRGQYVTPSYFRVLQIQPILGRVFLEEEGTLGKDKVAVLSEGLWRSNFGADRNVLGQDIRLSGVPYRIVGVVPDDRNLTSEPARVWVPFAFTPQQTSDDARHNNSWGMIARVQPGVSIRLAQQRIDDLNRRILDRFPQYRTLLTNARFMTKVIGLQDELTRDIRPTLYLVQGSVALVLLIGCVNLANLMLVRSSLRMKELAIRHSLGAGRWRLGRQLLTESVTLSVAGGALGVAVAWVGMRLLLWMGANELPRGNAIAVDARVLAFTGAVAVAAGLIFGSVPLLHVMRRDLNAVFRDNERGGTAGPRSSWLRSTLVVCQVSLAFVLLIGSGLLTLSFARLLSVDPGFRGENVASAQFSLPDSRYKEDAPARTFITGLLERLRAAPGIESAGATNFLPFGDSSNASAISIDGRPLGPGENPPVPGYNVVDSGYIPTMGIPLLQGRNLAESDGPDSQKVVLIDSFLARKYWPNGDAVGHGIRRGIDNKSPVFRIAGVVGSVKTSDLADQKPNGQVYFHYKQTVPRRMHLVLKYRSDGAQAVAAARREVLSLDPELPIYDTKTMPERIATSVKAKRAAMILCAIFGALALLLASVGIYGVLSYAVAQRTREIGIRAALGAGAGDILEMVAGQGALVAGAGLVIGVVAAYFTSRLMTALLYEVKPADPRVFLACAVLLAVVAAAATLIPSLRALRIHPATALRYE